MDIKTELYNTVDMMIRQAAGTGRQSDYEGTITKVSENKCEVMIDKNKYSVKNGTNIEFRPGNHCLVHCINGDFNRKVILAKL